MSIIVVVGATWFGLFSFLGMNTAYGTVTTAEEEGVAPQPPISARKGAERSHHLRARDGRAAPGRCRTLPL